MPILRHAKKKLRVDRKKEAVNKVVKSKASRAMARAREEKTEESLRAAFSAVDRATKKKVFKKGKAARIKSRLSKLMGSKRKTTKPKSAA